LSQEESSPNGLEKKSFRSERAEQRGSNTSFIIWGWL